MDEILATIRRIIAEDERSSSAGTRGAPAGVGPVAVSSPGASPPGVSPLGVSKERAEGSREAAQASAELAGANDVLDLTDALDEEGGARGVAPLGTVPAAPVHVRPPVETEAAEPIMAEPKPAEASPESGLAADPGPAAPPPAEPPSANHERLVSDVAALAAATAFGRLAAAPRVRREPPLVGGRPLDEMVRDLLRPLLQTWLDENLPGIVERLVEAEIARISARSGPG